MVVVVILMAEAVVVIIMEVVVVVVAIEVAVVTLEDVSYLFLAKFCISMFIKLLFVV